MMWCDLWRFCGLVAALLIGTTMMTRHAVAEPAGASPSALVVWVKGATGAGGQVVVVDVGASPLKATPQVSLGAGGAARGHVASDGVHVCAASGEQARAVVTWGPLGAPLTGSTQLPEGLTLEDVITTAMSGSRCYLGLSRARVAEVNFGTSPPAVKVFAPPPEVGDNPYKSVDVIVDMGNKLLAVDDIMSPFYAFLFDKAVDGALTYQHTVSLGYDINATYRWGLYHDGVVGLLNSNNHRGGWGQALTFYTAAALDVPMKEEGERLPALGHLGESMRRGSTSTEHLLGGDAWTPMQGAAVAGAWLMVAAGERGLMVAPWDKAKGAGAVKVVKVAPQGGACLDVRARGDQAWVLRERAGAAEVAQVAWDAASERLIDVQVIAVPHGAQALLW